jgi:hypothetical protein
VPGHLALGEGYLKKQRGFPECPGMGIRGRGFLKTEFLPRVLHSGRGFKKREISKKTGDGADGVKSSPRGSMALRKAFPECFGVFPECI